MSWSQNPSTYMFPSSHLPEGIPASFLPSFLNYFPDCSLSMPCLQRILCIYTLFQQCQASFHVRKLQHSGSSLPTGRSSYGGKALWCKGTTASAIALRTELPQARHISAAML